MIKRHRWVVDVEQSHDEVWRVYKCQVKDSQAFEYVLKRRINAECRIYKEIGTFPTAAQAWQYAEDIESEDASQAATA